MRTMGCLTLITYIGPTGNILGHRIAGDPGEAPSESRRIASGTRTTEVQDREEAERLIEAATARAQPSNSG